LKRLTHPTVICQGKKSSPPYNLAHLLQSDRFYTRAVGHDANHSAVLSRPFFVVLAVVAMGRAHKTWQKLKNIATKGINERL
jgi:prephenate dehydrogenase